MREVKYYCGGYLRVHQFPVRKSASGKRGKRQNVTSDIQARLNAKNAFHRMADLLHTNFTADDLAVTFSYTDDDMPETVDDAQRNMQNYIRRVKRRFKSEIKYIYITEQARSGRIHHHLVISGGNFTRDELEKMWKFGYCNSRRLQFNENGLEGLAKYFVKEPAKKANNKIIRRWNSSKKLKQPTVRSNDYRISRKTAKRINYHPQDREFIESLYPGYCLNRCETSPANEFSAGIFLTIYLYKKKEKK